MIDEKPDASAWLLLFLRELSVVAQEGGDIRPVVEICDNLGEALDQIREPAEELGVIAIDEIEEDGGEVLQTFQLSATIGAFDGVQRFAADEEG